MRGLLTFSNGVQRMLQLIGDFFGLAFILCVITICFDVLSRKLGYQIPHFGSTRLQELEWHFHTALFSFWLGLAYLKNAHVRIDIALMNASPRTHARMELFGLLVFAIPYCLVALYFSWDFVKRAWILNEGSDSATGLSYRWIPKGFLFFGILLLNLAVFAVLARIIVFIYGPPELRKQAEFGAAKAH